MSARPLPSVFKPEVAGKRIKDPLDEVVKPPVAVGLRARPLISVFKPEVDGRRTAAPDVPVCKPPVVVGVNVKLVPVSVTPLDAVYVPAPEN